MNKAAGRLLAPLIWVLGLCLVPSGAGAALHTGVIDAPGSATAPERPVFVPGTPPTVHDSASTRGLGPSRLFQAGAQISGVRHSPLPDPTAYPFSTHGKLLIGIAGFRASCSATVIATPNRSTVVTAAHCVREGFGNRGRWARRAVFIPAYDRGRRPFGSFKAAAIWVPRAYWRSQNPNFDVAVLKLRPSEAGRVAQVTGARGWAAGVSRHRRFRIFGYPAGAARGELPRVCTSRFAGIRRIARFLPGPAPTRVICHMARGSSGGGWIYGGRYLNSVISHSTPRRPEALYGPYFGREVERMIRRFGRR